MTPGSRAFGAFLKELREARRLSLEDVERLTGAEPGFACVSRSLLSRVERGQASISAAKLVVLARVYRVRPGFLADRLELAERPGAPAPAIEGGDRASRVRARLRAARTLAAAGRPLAARATLEDLLGERLGPEERAWTLYLLAHCSLQLGHALLARGAYLCLREVPRPWPREIERAAPVLEGEYLLFEERLEPASAAFVDALEAAIRGSEPAEQVPCLFRLAEIARRRGRLAEAAGWVGRARAIAQPLGLGPFLVQADLEEGRIEFARGRPERARDAWTRARRLARRLELPAALFDVYVEVYRLAAREGDAAEARVALRNLRRLGPLLERVPPAARDLEPLLRDGG